MSTILSNGISLTGGRQIGEDEQHQAAELGVAFDGRYFRYQEYRYDQLSDAVNYAHLDRAKLGYRAKPLHLPEWLAAPVPTESEQALMLEFAIIFDSKYFHFGSYRYDHFNDALSYAQLMRKPTASGDPGGHDRS